MRKYFIGWIGLLCICCGIMAAAEKTDLTKESYVESSPIDFVLSATNAPSASANVAVFDIKAPSDGAYTLVSFIDGAFWACQPIKLPGQFKLNMRGLAPGKHKLTLQAVDKNGQLGAAKLVLTR